MCVRPDSLTLAHTLSHLNPSVSKCRNRTRFISLAALLFGGEFRNLAARSTAVCSLRLKTSKRQSLCWEKHRACNIAALACCWAAKKKVQSDSCETHTVQLFNSDECRQKVNGNARVYYLSLFLCRRMDTVCPREG